jgi:hypothetical protein
MSLKSSGFFEKHNKVFLMVFGIIKVYWEKKTFILKFNVPQNILRLYIKKGLLNIIIIYKYIQTYIYSIIVFISVLSTNFFLNF